jgi:hypothetical protein
VKTIPPPCGNELVEKESVYAQEKTFITDTSVSRSFSLYYFRINPTQKKYSIQKAQYISNSIVEDYMILPIEIVSKGKIINNNDISECVEDSTNIVIQFKQLSEYFIEIITSNSYYVKGEILYLNKIEGYNNTPIKEMSWKNGLKDGWWIMYKADGRTKIFYEGGIAKDTIFQKWDDIEIKAMID